MASDRRLTLEHFRAFLAITECGGFAGAAERLMRTQSALTHQIQSLEEILGERLLMRSRGHYGGLTEDGKRFLPHARSVLGAVESACRSVGQPALAGKVRIGIMDDFDIRWLIDLIARFDVLHPGVETSTVSDLSSALEDRLARGDIDVAVTKRLVEPTGPMADNPLQIERLDWVAGAGFQWNGEGRLPVVVFHEGCVYRRRLVERLAQAGIDWRVGYAGHSYANIRAAVAAGLGVTALPEGLISPDHVIWQGAEMGIDLPDLGFAELLVRTAADRSDPIIAAFRLEIERWIGRTDYEKKRAADSVAAGR
jgi:DNA-binding transcriptional LysR family regulator